MSIFLSVCPCLPGGCGFRQALAHRFAVHGPCHCTHCTCLHGAHRLQRAAVCGLQAPACCRRHDLHVQLSCRLRLQLRIQLPCPVCRVLALHCRLRRRVSKNERWRLVRSLRSTHHHHQSSNNRIGSKFDGRFGVERRPQWLFANKFSFISSSQRLLFDSSQVGGYASSESI